MPSAAASVRQTGDPDAAYLLPAAVAQRHCLRGAHRDLRAVHVRVPPLGALDVQLHMVEVRIGVEAHRHTLAALHRGAALGVPGAPEAALATAAAGPATTEAAAAAATA